MNIDLKDMSQLTLIFSVDLREGHIWVRFARLLEDRRELAARAAPCGPELAEHDAVLDGLVVGVLGQGDSSHDDSNGRAAPTIPAIAPMIDPAIGTAAVLTTLRHELESL